MKQLTHSRPLFTVGVASNLVGASPQTLRNWEARGLITPLREGRSRRRLYSWSDIERLQQIRYLVTRKRIPLRAVKVELIKMSVSRPVLASAQPGSGRTGAPLVPRIALAIPR